MKIANRINQIEKEFEPFSQVPIRLKLNKKAKLILFILLGYWAVSVFTPIEMESRVDSVLLSPSMNYFFGTDSLGRDLFIRTLNAAKNSLGIGLLSAFLASLLGAVIGSVAAFNGRQFSWLLQQFIDIYSSIPAFILISFICLGQGIHQNWFYIVLAISLTHWMMPARLIRNKTLEINQQDFVTASIALGGRPLHIYFYHYLPQLKEIWLTVFALQIPACILYEGYVSFLGFGVLSPETSWGLLIKEGWKSLSTYPHLLLAPASQLFLCCWLLQVALEDIRNKNNNTHHPLP